MARPATQAPEQQHRPHKGGWRSPVAITLIVLACILAIPAIALSWANRELTNTDAYVKTVEPLVNSQTIQRVVTDKVTEAIFDNVDEDKLIDSGIDALVDAGVSEKITDIIENFDDSMASAVRGFVEREVAKIVASNTTAELWVTINRVVHSELAGALAGDDTEILRIEGDDLVADTGELTREVKQRIADRGFGLINLLPTISTDITLVSSPQISQTQSRYQEWTFAARVLPWIVAILFVVAIAVAWRRRRELVIAGIGVAIAMVVLLIALWIGSLVAPDSIPSEILPNDAARIVIDTLLHSIWRPIWFWFTVGLLVALIAYVAGPGRGARFVREYAVVAARWSRQAIARRGWHVSPVDYWVRRFAQPLMIAIGVVAVLTVWIWYDPTWQVPVWVAAFAGVGIFLVVFLAQPEPLPEVRESTGAEPQERHGAGDAMESFKGQVGKLKERFGERGAEPPLVKRDSGDHDSSSRKGDDSEKNLVVFRNVGPEDFGAHIFYARQQL